MPSHTGSERSKRKNVSGGSAGTGSQTNSTGNQKGFELDPQKSGALNKKIPPKRSPEVGSDTNSSGNQTGL